jgi:phage-related protein
MSTDPDQIRSEIDQTQRELSADVDALTEKLSPPRMVERRVRRTRTAMTNMKDRIMGSTSDAYQTAGPASSGVRESVSARASAARDTVAGTASSARDTVAGTASSARETVADTASSAADTARSAPETVRRRAEGNPLAAGLIAFGAGWLLSSLLPASGPEQRVASQVKDFAAEQGRPVAGQLGEAGQEVAQELKESAQQRAEAVKETATDAASTVAGEAQSAASDVTGQAQQSAGRVRDQGRGQV